MPTKTFLEHKGFKLISDERDVMVSKLHFAEVVDWCDHVGIAAELALSDYETVIANQLFNVDIWRVRDEQQRAMFVLRWL